MLIKIGVEKVKLTKATLSELKYENLCGRDTKFIKGFTTQTWIDGILDYMEDVVENKKQNH